MRGPTVLLASCLLELTHVRLDFFGEDSKFYEDAQVLQAGEGYEVKGLYGCLTSKIVGMGAFFGVRIVHPPSIGQRGPRL